MTFYFKKGKKIVA